MLWQTSQSKANTAQSLACDTPVLTHPNSSGGEDNFHTVLRFYEHNID